MNTAHIHLILNHLPVIGSAFVLLLLGVAMVRRSTELAKVALALLVLVALAAIPAYLTGEPTEKLIERYPGISKTVIERHEAAAAFALAGMEVLGLVALLGLMLFRRAHAVPRWFLTVSLGFSIVIAGLMAWTANLGGQIRHPEIGAGLPAAAQQQHDD